MPVSAPLRSCALGLVLLLGIGLVAGCSDRRSFPTELEPDEQRLVEEILDLIELRIAEARDPDEALAKREALGELYDPAAIEAIIAELSQDPKRGQLVVSAVRDSLDARRSRLLPPPVIEVP